MGLMGMGAHIGAHVRVVRIRVAGLGLRLRVRGWGYFHCTRRHKRLKILNHLGFCASPLGYLGRPDARLVLSHVTIVAVAGRRLEVALLTAVHLVRFGMQIKLVLPEMTLLLVAVSAKLANKRLESRVGDLMKAQARPMLIPRITQQTLKGLICRVNGSMLA